MSKVIVGAVVDGDGDGVGSPSKARLSVKKAKNAKMMIVSTTIKKTSGVIGI
jgi:hypothetical protein